MATLKVLDGDGTARYLEVTGTGTEGDPFVASSKITSPLGVLGEEVVGIDHVHDEIHAGKSFICSGAGSLGSGGIKNLLITAPDSAVRMHFHFGVRGTVETNAVLYESPDTSGGSSVPVYNRDRNSANMPTGVVTVDVTVAATGTTALEEIHFGTTNKAGGEGGSRKEWLLKQNTDYLLQITSEAANNDASWELDWYEES